MKVKKVLVIDDESDIREVAKLCLEINSNWDVLTADSGENGIAVATTEKPDAILLDVMMPNMDGLATLIRLQENQTTKDIPVILLTAKVQATQEYRYQTAFDTDRPSLQAPVCRMSLPNKNRGI